jgi:hypothetical protein
VAFLFCQTSLLGLWAAPTSRNVAQRILGALLGTAYLSMLMVVAFRKRWLLGLVVTAVLGVAGPLLLMDAASMPLFSGIAGDRSPSGLSAGNPGFFCRREIFDYNGQPVNDITHLNRAVSVGSFPK